MTQPNIDPQVIIPYSQLCDLLQASVELRKIRMEVKRLSDQQTALRGMFFELMERFKELE